MNSRESSTQGPDRFRKGAAVSRGVRSVNPAGFAYEDTVSTRWFRGIVLVLAGVLAATGAYLASLRVIERFGDTVYTNRQSMWVFLGHLAVGFLILPPLVRFFADAARSETEPRSTVAKCVLFVSALAVVASGVALCQFHGLPRLPEGTRERLVFYLAHVIAPLPLAVAYAAWRRRVSGVHWHWGGLWLAGTTVLVAGALALHARHPQPWNTPGSELTRTAFEPSKTRTVDGMPIPAESLMSDEYCRRCHEDTYQDWFHSVHHFSSFNNPVYRFSVRETREVGLARDGDVRASRWCAGCHDPVPFLAGQWDDPNYDDRTNPTASAGITCTACHAITHVNSTIGNGAYTIESPQHYPLALSEHPALQWVSDQVLKARPDFHKKSMLKDLHRSPEFCSTCHKVSLPMALNHYREFLRGQNHYDTFLLSGASGHGARGFYYPDVARTTCNDCHMPLRRSGNDHGGRDFDGSGIAKLHSHLAPGANTGVPWLVSETKEDAETAESLRGAVQAHTDFLRGQNEWSMKPALRIDLFGIKERASIDAPLIAPLRPNLPVLAPGKEYLIEVVIRTLAIGHLFTDGTADSNEVWVELTAKSGDRVLGQSGGLSGPGDSGEVDRWGHFVKALVLDRNGNRINRHNPQDIFVAVYNHQIPPGAAQVVHYALDVPADVSGPIEVHVRLRYRKFDHEYTSYVAIQDHPEFLPMLREAESIPDLLNRRPDAVAKILDTRLDRVSTLPIVDLCEDRVILPVAGIAHSVPEQASPIRPAWERWNDYGIGCYLEGGVGAKQGELRQAEEAFKTIRNDPDKEAHAHALTNLARVYLDEGRLSDAAAVLNEAGRLDPPAPWWTVAWLTGSVNAETGHFEEAVRCFEQIIDPDNQVRERRFDFTKDYVIINQLAATLFKLAQQQSDEAARDDYLHQAIRRYDATLRLDPEDLLANYGLSQCFARLGGVGDLPDADKEERVGAEDLLTFARRLADPGATDEERLGAASRLFRGIEPFNASRADPHHPKFEVWKELVRICRPASGIDTGDADAPLPKETHRRAAAAVLSLVYRHIHEVLKPDEIARDRTVRLYREKNPAADHAAEAIVIYDLNRNEAVNAEQARSGLHDVKDVP
ncbi:MAG: tetratricopeptide repeat protein [Planctomycetes bacterium]|nr:tetratricopeptide repeat protein [Planctomycetota bacterium]